VLWYLLADPNVSAVEHEWSRAGLLSVLCAVGSFGNMKFGTRSGEWIRITDVLAVASAFRLARLRFKRRSSYFEFCAGNDRCCPRATGWEDKVQGQPEHRDHEVGFGCFEWTGFCFGACHSVCVPACAVDSACCVT
jgi:hypothetical protein